MSLEESVKLQCPYCWEMIEMLIDCSTEEQHYIEDCSVCCRPIVLRVKLDQFHHPQVDAFREDDA